MARSAMLKLLFLLLVTWHCDAKSSSKKPSLKVSTTVAPVEKIDATTVKAEKPAVSSTPGSVDPEVSKDEPSKDDLEFLDILEDVNVTAAIGAKSSITRKCNKRDRVNEIYSQCGNNACQNTCANPNAAIGCSGSCVAGCICVAGFLRNGQGRCVLPSQCDARPACPGPNEIFSFCGNDGCQASCNRLNTAGCIAICNSPACICAAGFVRNSLGVCVLPSSCPSQSCIGPNEVFTQCGNDGCQATCDRLDLATLCRPFCSSPGCVCAQGFVRNSVGVCVLPSQCPTMTCTGANEIFSRCGEDGCQRTCNRLDVGGCQPICSSPRCICNIGFVRNAAGACVLPSSCPSMSCTGVNEIFSFCGNDGCQRTCTRLDVTGCIATCNVPACICASGFVRNQQGICVLQSACPTTTTCGANEVFSNCGNDGCQRSCMRLVITNCNAVCTTPSCVCAAGFVRNTAGACILPTSCPTTTCNGANEVFSACGNDGCQPTCTTPVVTGCVSNCNTPACICAAGFVRNGAGLCVLPSSCVMSCNGANQVFSACGNDNCQRSCTRLDVTGCVSTCSTPACICAPGFVLNSAGACVLPSTCPSVTCTGANQIFSACGNDNCQRSCNRLVVTGCTPTCAAPGCICAPGFVTNTAGDCILPTACPTTTCNGANQIFSACGNDNCQRSCTRLTVTGCTPVCGTPGCICAPGFVANTAGACVLPSACPTTTCGMNEVFSACGNDGCQTSCTMLTRPGCAPTCGTPACICATGFVRNAATGACVAPSTCPTTTCGMNEVFSACGNDGCQTSCTMLTRPGCAPTCGTPACICASGFVRNAATGACVAPSTCPTSVTCTGQNEIFSGCGNDGCQRTCTVLNVPATCAPVCATPACICLSGFVRNVQGVCVPPSSCPTMACTAQNQIFSGCGNDGCQSTCAVRAPNPCTSVCTTPACVCAPGFVMNAMGVCIAPTQCPLPTCGTNEIFSQCGNDNCRPTCTNPDRTGCIPVCATPACICAPGFVRNAMNACVPPAMCPAPTCTNPNEVVSMCGNDGCQPTCQRSNVGTCIPVCSTPACVCATGFVRNTATGLCVLLSACPMMCTGVNEVFSMCGNNNCQGTCAVPADPTCMGVCTPGCICTAGFVRNSAGTCVAMANCQTCTGPRERFLACGMNVCEPTCANPMISMADCNTQGQCSSKCFCVPGQVRLATGVCDSRVNC